MYERLLDKVNRPTFEEFSNYCGKCKNEFIEIDRYLSQEKGLDKLLRYPYGKHYGWAYKYTFNNKLVSDIFAERDSFTAMIRLSNKEIDSIYESLTERSKRIIDDKYPCGEGGWIYLRVCEGTDLVDLKKILSLKIKSRL